MFNESQKCMFKNQNFAGLRDPARACLRAAMDSMLKQTHERGQ